MKKILLVFIISLNFVSFANEKKDTNNNLLNRISSLENLTKEENLEIDGIKKQYSVDLKEIENKYKEKENILKEKLIDIKNEKEEIKLEKNEILKKLNILYILFKWIGIGSLAAIIVGAINFFKLWKKIDEKIKEEADKKIKHQVKKEVEEKTAEIVNCEREKIIEIVKKYDEEWRLKQNKKICVLSADIKKEDELRKVLCDFKKVDYEDIENSDSLDYDKYNMILLNHNNKNVTKEAIEDIVKKIKEKNKETLFFYYGKEFLSKDIENINYCKSIFTLYGNLIDLLRTQDLLEK